MDTKVMLVTLMVVLIVFIVLLAVLGIIFIVALRKRTPVVKVVMAPQVKADEPEPEQKPAVSADATSVAAEESSVPPVAAAPAPEPEPEPEPEEEEDDEAPTFVTEGQERVSYNRSLTAKICQLPEASKEWYSGLKNELLSYEKAKARMSWRHETFRLGRMVAARFVVRGKTLCLLLAVEPAGYNGTKFAVDDVSNVASLADTPTMYRIKSARRFKYAKEMITGIMKELKVYKDPRYEAKDFFLPYEGDMSLMQKGLVKRVVSGTTRTFKIEEVDGNAIKEAAATDDENK
ncbi:MAG: hypothetical protein J1G38_04155 [Clostridiales bacterium]|nr:hypothetical protein [Clostridiales bacterium]